MSGPRIPIGALMLAAMAALPRSAMEVRRFPEDEIPPPPAPPKWEPTAAEKFERHLQSMDLTGDGSKIRVDQRNWPKSKHMPHIGKKQMEKAARRAAKQENR